MTGDISQLTPRVESYIKILSETLLLMPNIIEKISINPIATRNGLKKILASKSFNKVSFNEAVKILLDNNKDECVRTTEQGRDITALGEIELANILNYKEPFWIENYDRDRVPFYQKPHPNNQMKVLNADLIFPPLIESSFGGEVAGCGQRQDNAEEILESLHRQNIDPKPYEWYVALRRLPNYKTTSGFGLGVERFIAWALCREDIKEVIFYPRLKNIVTYP